MDKSKPTVSANIVVHNGKRYIRHCLDSLKKQTSPNIEVNILDNGSTDGTPEIVKNEYPDFRLIESPKNLGMWPGQEELLSYSHGQYVASISVDVILDTKFIEEALKVLESNGGIGAIQGKIYRYELVENTARKTNFIDTCGFKVARSREITNIGHGEEDRGQHNQECEIIAVEGAVPVFRREALENCRLDNQRNKIFDPDFFWYGDDLDLAWRMRLFGWKQVYAPNVIAWHDRKTTKNLSGNVWEFIRMRRTIPLFKRKLDARNTTLAIVKNDYARNILKDLPYIFWRQSRLWGYYLLFEPTVFLEIINIVKLMPHMLKRRREIMQKAKVGAGEMHRWFE